MLTVATHQEAPPYTVRPLEAPTSAFLAEAARRIEEEKESARVDPWQSDVDEEEDVEAAEEEDKDPLGGERIHAWVRPQIDVCSVECGSGTTSKGDWDTP